MIECGDTVSRDEPPEARRAGPAAPARLSASTRSRFVTGVQCHLLLWRTVNEPAAAELAKAEPTDEYVDESVRVGEIARNYLRGGVLIDVPAHQLKQRVERTKAQMESGSRMIYEAAFGAQGVFAAIDILHRASASGPWTVTSAKSATRVKDDHLLDSAVQTWVAARSGAPISKVEIMHLNRDCVHPDLSNLFTTVDVTAPVRGMLDRIGREAKRQLDIVQQKMPPVVQPGRQCESPEPCPFLERCTGPRPKHHISTLHRLTPERHAELLGKGIESIHDLPRDTELTQTGERQRAAVQSGRTVVEPALARTLMALEPPIAHLQMRSVAPAIPRWIGSRPYDAVPVLFSVHREVGKPGQPGHKLEHHEYIAHGDADPRSDFARSLVVALSGAKTILLYGATFERWRLIEIARVAIEVEPELEAMAARLVDLLPIVKSNVYHPDFDGSFALPDVSSALVPGFGYDDLRIKSRHAARRAIHTWVFDADRLPESQREALRCSILARVERESLATAMVIDALRSLAHIA